MLLCDLLRQFDPTISCSALPEVDVTGIQEDSRKVRDGDLFIARAGTKTDGLRYISDAYGRGAVAVVTQTRAAACPLPQVVVADAAKAASGLAHVLHGRPSETVRVVGITGTSGKTTTTYLIRHLLEKVGRRCGVIGTVEIDDGRSRVEATMTTPGPIEVAGLLARMRDNRCDACAMEISSHALDQGRVAGMRFGGAAFTNLGVTGDHLDYHKTMDNYAAAKARLFEMLDGASVAVVNTGDTWSERMVRDCRARVVRFGFDASSEYRASAVSFTNQGSQFLLKTPDGEAPVQMLLMGRHNVENALTAAALAGEVFGLSIHQIVSGLRDAQGAPGRLQAVRFGQPFAVLVDYAHKDDALRNVLTALRPLTRGKLRVVFGCGGDRDRTKRPRMARTAQELADVVYVTSDNPRTENPQAIINEIVSGFAADTEKSIVVEPDRRAAIERALTDARDEDVVLLAGKGHENYQIIGTEKRHFDDVEEAMKVLKRICDLRLPICDLKSGNP